jgi:hypothetical protein
MPVLSIIVGAGFSSPAGYPTSEELNNRLLSLNKGSLCHSFFGEVSQIDAKMPASFLAEIDLCIDLMHYYADKMGHFYYKDFYDYLLEEVFSDDGIYNVFDKELFNDESVLYAIGSLKYIFNKLIDICNTDKHGCWRYDDESSIDKSLFIPYERFFGQLNIYDEIHIHSLNDDLLTDGLKSLSCIDGNYSDGFEFNQPSYLGEIWNGYCEVQETVELPQFIGKFEKRLNLYKLRGSRDFYALYRPLQQESYRGKDVIVKINRKVDRISYNGVYLPFNYRGEFLSGLCANSVRANYPVYYNLIFDKFKKNLIKSDMLVIIGYGCKDKDINDVILRYYDSTKRSVFIDSNPSEMILQLGKNLNSEMIIEPFENVRNIVV